jgi:hypothetical protein
MDYLERSARIRQTDKVKMKQLEMGKNKRHVTGKRRSATIATSYEWRTAELLDGLQNGTHRGKEVAADQSVYDRMGLGTA